MSPAGFPPLIRWVLWGAISSSVIFYFVILRAGLIEHTSGVADPHLSLLFSIIGFTLAVVSVGIRFVVRGVRDGNGRPKVPGWIFPAFIVALALGEVPGILGFILGLQGHGLKTILPLFAVSLAPCSQTTPRVSSRGPMMSFETSTQRASERPAQTAASPRITLAATLARARPA